MVQNNDNKDIKKVLDSFLENEETLSKLNNKIESEENLSVIKGDNSLQERINKKIIIEDGRQLLI
jgi:hypothetical protein